MFRPSAPSIPRSRFSCRFTFSAQLKSDTVRIDKQSHNVLSTTFGQRQRVYMPIHFNMLIHSITSTHSLRIHTYTYYFINTHANAYTEAAMQRDMHRCTPISIRLLIHSYGLEFTHASKQPCIVRLLMWSVWIVDTSFRVVARVRIGVVLRTSASVPHRTI